MNASPARKKPPLAVVGSSDKFNAIQKVCAVLRVLAQSSPLRLTEIADATSLNKATTLRILGSLIEEGFVSRVTGAKTYELGQEARVMAVGARRTVDIAELAQPSLLRVSERSADPRCCRCAAVSRRSIWRAPSAAIRCSRTICRSAADGRSVSAPAVSR